MHSNLPLRSDQPAQFLVPWVQVEGMDFIKWYERFNSIYGQLYELEND